MKKRVTIKDIARELDLSTSTVSRALANDKNIRSQTQSRVLSKAKELGYSPNPIATNLKFGCTNSIGVIVPEMVTPFASAVIEGIQSVLHEKGLRVMIANSNESSEQEAENLNLMQQFMVDGVIISLCDYSANRELFDKFRESGIPLLFYDRIPHGIEESTQVVINDYTSAFFLVEELIRSGRKRIAYLAGPKYIYNSKERERGYRDAMRKFSLEVEPSMVVTAGVSFDDGAAAVDRVEGCDAIFAFTDTLAIGAMNRLVRNGVRVPQDVAVAGFSGTELSTIVTPELTSVVAPLFQMGVRSAEIILDMIADYNAKPYIETLESEITLRRSTHPDS
ncbi:MAG: LacI family DNA-binding transcriptional regulator [Rikenellaceae bacterium]